MWVASSSAIRSGQTILRKPRRRRRRGVRGRRGPRSPACRLIGLRPDRAASRIVIVDSPSSPPANAGMSVRCERRMIHNARSVARLAVTARRPPCEEVAIVAIPLSVFAAARFLAGRGVVGSDPRSESVSIRFVSLSSSCVRSVVRFVIVDGFSICGREAATLRPPAAQFAASSVMHPVRRDRSRKTAGRSRSGSAITARVTLMNCF